MRSTSVAVPPAARTRPTAASMSPPGTWAPPTAARRRRRNPPWASCPRCSTRPRPGRAEGPAEELAEEPPEPGRVDHVEGQVGEVGRAGGGGRARRRLPQGEGHALVVGAVRPRPVRHLHRVGGGTAQVSDRLDRGVHVVHLPGEVELASVVTAVQRDPRHRVRDPAGVGPIGGDIRPPEDRSVEGLSHVEVGDQERHVAQVAMAAAGRFGAGRLRQQPAVAEGVDDGGVAAVLVVGRRPVERRPLVRRPGDQGVDVGRLQVEGDGRARPGPGRGVADVGELVGQHHQRPAEVELGVADPTVGHLDGLAPEAGAEDVGVPVDRPAGVGDGEVGGEGHPGGGRPRRSWRRRVLRAW